MELSSYKNKKNILIFWEMKLSSPWNKNIFIFSQKTFPYISRNGAFLEKLLIFQEETSELEK